MKAADDSCAIKNPPVYAEFCSCLQRLLNLFLAFVFLNLHSGPGGMHGYTDLPKVSRTTLKSAADIGLYFLKAQSKVPFVGAHGTYSVVGVVVIRVAMV